MNKQTTRLVAAPFAGLAPTWAAGSTLPTHETYPAAAETSTNFYNEAPACTPRLDVTSPPGTTGQISGATGTGDIEFTVRLSGPPAADLHALLDVVFATEAALREVLAPDKVNLASLGNVVPHLHWHVIPRFSDDPHFPNAVWGERKRDTPHGAAADVGGRLAAVLTRRLGRARETG